MTRGKLKIALRRKRIEKNIKKATVVIEGCLTVALLVTALGLDSNAEPAIKEIEVDNYESVVANNNNGVTAGVASVLYDATSIDIEKRQLELVQSSIEIDVDTLENSTETISLIEPGTILYASTNLNVRLKPDENYTRLGGLKAGDKLIVNEDTGNGWVQVTYKDAQAYVCSDFLVTEAPMLLVSSTAYYDEYNRHSASMRELIEGHSIAGKVSWLNRSVNIYKCNSDGTVGDFIGTYTFDDTGYGAESGIGESKILEGRTIGTIENGTCIDFFFDTEAECVEYGRRNVYIQFID